MAGDSGGIGCSVAIARLAMRTKIALRRVTKCDAGPVYRQRSVAGVSDIAHSGPMRGRGRFPNTLVPLTVGAGEGWRDEVVALLRSRSPEDPDGPLQQPLHVPSLRGGSGLRDPRDAQSARCGADASQATESRSIEPLPAGAVASFPSGIDGEASFADSSPATRRASTSRRPVANAS